MTALPRWPYVTIALTLSSVTVISVCLAIGALIQDPFLMVLFGAAGALLDLAKYMSWPLAAHLISEGRKPLAGALMGCALAMACVSGWATFDRLLVAMMGGHGEAVAVQQRIADLESSREIELARLTTLAENERATQGQLFALRDKTVVRATVEVERVAMRRLDEQRAKSKSELETISLELAELRAKPMRTATLPMGMAVVICLGVALALELFPAFLLTATRPRPVAGSKDVSAPETTENRPKTELYLQQKRTETQEEQDKLSQGETQQIQQERAVGLDEILLQNLLQSVNELPPGTPIVLRKFVKEQRIGNSRAMTIFEAAEAKGALRKVASGYVVAERSQE